MAEHGGLYGVESKEIPLLNKNFFGILKPYGVLSVLQFQCDKRRWKIDASTANMAQIITVAVQINNW